MSRDGLLRPRPGVNGTLLSITHSKRRCVCRPTDGLTGKRAGLQYARIAKDKTPHPPRSVEYIHAERDEGASVKCERVSARERERRADKRTQASSECTEETPRLPARWQHPGTLSQSAGRHEDCPRHVTCTSAHAIDLGFWCVFLASLFQENQVLLVRYRGVSGFFTCSS